MLQQERCRAARWGEAAAQRGLPGAAVGISCAVMGFIFPIAWCLLLRMLDELQRHGEAELQPSYRPRKSSSQGALQKARS